ncbi:MAG: hypothetical protein ACPHN2_00750 [Sinimarinibacterium flocculans]|uniref:hypothetical protein n=1 Tax=Sinimarinibacterium flocculans TaxID=985250 RepID=UPI003C4CEF76
MDEARNIDTRATGIQGDRNKFRLVIDQPYTTEPVSFEKADRRYVVTSRVTGTFPGSPVDLRFTFSLERGRIASLVITP